MNKPVEVEHKHEDKKPEKTNLDILKERLAAHNMIDPDILIAVLNDLSGTDNPKPEEEAE